MKYLALLAAIVLLPACATTKAEKNVTEDLKQESPVYSQQGVAEKAHDIILNHPSLNAKQREQMRELFGEVYRKSIQIRSEIGKMKGVFFKALFSSEHKEDEIKILKRKLLAANQSKMDLMLDALDKAVVILGKDIDPHKFENLFMEIDRLHNPDKAP